ncbi:hypothetical protein ACSBR2_037488 [Camellia fascicularis]
MSIRTIKVSNVSLGATLQDVKEFFSFSGDIEYVEMLSHTERSQIAFVTFKDSQGAQTAVLLSKTENKTAGGSESAFQKAEDVVSGVLAKGFVLGKDAVSKVKSFDEKHQLTSTATAKVVSFDKKIGLSEKFSAGTSVVNEKVRGVDQRFQVSDKTKSAYAVAEQKVSSAGSAIMKNPYVQTGTTWVTGAFSKVAKAAGDVGQKTKQKVGMAEEEQRRKMVDEFAQIHLSESPKSPNLQQSSKPAPAQGLIL